MFNSQAESNNPNPILVAFRNENFGLSENAVRVWLAQEWDLEISSEKPTDAFGKHFVHASDVLNRLIKIVVKPVRVYWYTCDCPWWTKYCDEAHRVSSSIPMEILKKYKDN